MTEAEKEDTIAKLRDWLESPEGKIKMAEIAEQCRKMREDLEKSLKVDPEILRKPMDF